ncbi:MAG TPA: hypothetical protein VGS98_13665 [Thermoanaerobaculia bacterium]|jgi:uncharacterized small protein (DUF1192 family)|nr:hypothetical protein [Thermoanaerobaculia bacterium]
MTREPRVLRLAFLFSAGLSSIAAAPRPTPTPEPRLTGGFGKEPAAERSARRSAEKKKVRITNQSLVTEPDKGKVSTSDVKPAPTPTARSRPTRARPVASDEAASAPEDGEEFWREEARRLRERVAAIREEITRLEAEVKKLESDFYSWDDGLYRDRVIKPAWDKAREELATARKELPEAEKDLADLPDRARKAGAQPGWIRE